MKSATPFGKASSVIWSLVLAIVGSIANMADAQPAAAVGNLARGFPRLDHKFKVIDRPVNDYNCIAYTLGMTDQWIDPKTGPADAPFKYMDQLYGKYGYHRTTNLDLRFNPNEEKVAVYATRAPDGNIRTITHAALQGSDGRWTSKMGHLPLIRHASPFVVDGPTYGAPVATYVRTAKRNPVFAPGGTGIDVGGPGLGHAVSNAAHHGLHGRSLANFVHELQSLRNKENHHRGGENGFFTAGFHSGRRILCAAENEKAGAAKTPRGPQNPGNVKAAGNQMNSLVANRLPANETRRSANPMVIGANNKGSFAGGFKAAGNNVKATGNQMNSLVANRLPTNDIRRTANPMVIGANNKGSLSGGFNATNKQVQNGHKSGRNASDFAGAFAGRHMASNPGILVRVRGDGNNVNINAPGGSKGIFVSIKGHGNNVNINVGSAKSGHNFVAANAIGNKRSGPGNHGNPANVGNAKNASHARQVAPGDICSVRDAGKKQLGGNIFKNQKSPGAQLGNGNLAKNGSANRGPLNAANAKKSGDPLSALLSNNSVKNLANAKSISNTKNVGAAKNAGNGAHASCGVKDAGHSRMPQNLKNVANNSKGPGAKLGNATSAKNTTMPGNNSKAAGAALGNNNTAKNLAMNVGNTKGLGSSLGGKTMAKNVAHTSKTGPAATTQKGPFINAGAAKNVASNAKAGTMNAGSAKNGPSNARTGPMNAGVAKNAGMIAKAPPNSGVAKTAANTPALKSPAPKNFGVQQAKNFNPTQKGPANIAKSSQTAGNAAKMNQAKGPSNALAHAPKGLANNAKAPAMNQQQNRSFTQPRPAVQQGPARMPQMAGNRNGAINRGVAQVQTMGRRR